MAQHLLRRVPFHVCGPRVLRTVRNKEQNTGSQASVHGTLEKFGLVEEQVQMSGTVEFRIFQTVDVVDVLVEDAQ